MSSLRGARAFTIIELLVSTAVLALILGILLAITSQVQSTFSRTAGRIEQFGNARTAFESIERRLSQATLNTYWNYDDPITPTTYRRQSELRFVSGPAADLLSGVSKVTDPTGHAVFFQAPLGLVETPPDAPLPTLLNTWGYYVDYTDGSAHRPPFITSPAEQRYRLIELMEPSEHLAVYSYTSGPGREGATAENYTYNWLKDPLGKDSNPGDGFPDYARVLAENIVALVLLPKLSAEADPTGARLASNFLYDSTVSNADPEVNSLHQLPPIVQVTMVAIDEKSAARMTASQASSLRTKVNGSFGSASSYSTDLASLEDFLTEQNLSYRVFQSDVNIPGAKWSTEQTN